MSRFRYTIKADAVKAKCVFRMNFGTKYFIWKSPGLKASLETMCRDLDRKVNSGCKPEDLFCKLVTHCKRYRAYDFTVQVLFESQDHNELLEAEGMLLEAAKGDQHCLNSVFEPYKPKWILETPTQNKAPRATITPAEVHTVQKSDISRPAEDLPPPAPKPAPSNTVKKERKYDIGALASALKKSMTADGDDNKS